MTDRHRHNSVKQLREWFKHIRLKNGIVTASNNLIKTKKQKWNHTVEPVNGIPLAGGGSSTFLGTGTCTFSSGTSFFGTSGT